MKNKTFKFIFIFSILILTSCKEAKKESIEIMESNEDILLFEFPDTVKLNQNNFGKIQYNLDIDSIDISEIDERYILFYLTNKKEEINLKSIEDIEHKIFIDTIGDGTFRFDIDFTKNGKNLLNGLIEDKIFLKTPTNDGKIRIITKETKISKDVYVIGNDSK